MINEIILHHFCEYLPPQIELSFHNNSHANTNDTIAFFLGYAPQFIVNPYDDINETEIREDYYYCGPFAKLVREMSRQYNKK